VADVALLASQAGEAPIGYQVPGAQEIILKSITASFDGSGASGNFLPVLQIVAPNGAVLASCPVGSTLAAGASADVSWFPRGGVATSGSGSGITEIDSGDGSITVTNPTGPITDLSVNFPASTSDYVFVAERAPVANAFTFTAIPQDARHLVLFVAFKFASTVPLLQFNGDGGANYFTLFETVQDFNGAVTNTSSSTTATQTAIYLQGMDGEYPSTAVITIPYYRFAFGSGFRDRSCLVDSTTHTDDTAAGIHLHRRTNLAGWWDPSPGNAAPAITSIVLTIAGGTGRASLYKVK
jgi:hypothetical protein